MLELYEGIKEPLKKWLARIEPKPKPLRIIRTRWGNETDVVKRAGIFRRGIKGDGGEEQWTT